MSLRVPGRDLVDEKTSRNFTTGWAIVGGFLAGVFIASLLPIGYVAALFVLFIAAIAGTFIFIDSAKKSAMTLVLVACVAFAGGIARIHATTRVGDPHLSAQIGKSVVIRGTVSEEPDVREGSVRLTVDVTSLGASTTVPVHSRVLVVAPARADAQYGDVVEAKGTLELPDAFDTTGGRQFDYPKYLAKDGILYTLSFAQVQTTGENHGNVAKAAAIYVKHLFLYGLGQALAEPEAGLAGGITVGDKRSIGKELSADFQRVSLIHMIVLSGYNITVVINAVMAVLGNFAQSIRFSAAGMVVVMFALMAGGAASAVRAGAMALIAIFARITHRVYLAERILGVVCAGMVLWNPWTLCFDPSFQLSALATLGLVLFSPIFAAWCTRVPERFGLREIVASTLGTQVMVLPLLLYQNGTLSLVALPANLLALVTVPAAMGFSAFAGAVGLFTGPLAPLFGAPAYVLLWYEIHVATLFAALPFAAVSVPVFSAWWMCAAYATLFAWYWYYKKKAEQSSANR